MRYRILLGLAAIVAVVAACSSTSSDDTPTSVTATVSPSSTDPSDAAPGEPEPVVVDPEVANPRRVTVDALTTATEGGRHVALPVWVSGVAPCYQLQRVDVEQNATEISITIWEGGDPHAVCVEIAVEKTTTVDLGELEPGIYTVTAPKTDGQGPSVELVVE